LISRESAAKALQTVAPANGLRLSEYPADPSLVGKTVAEIAAVAVAPRAGGIRGRSGDHGTGAAAGEEEKGLSSRFADVD
jgi:hypothetical protein